MIVKKNVRFLKCEYVNIQKRQMNFNIDTIKRNDYDLIIEKARYLYKKASFSHYEYSNYIKLYKKLIIYEIINNINSSIVDHLIIIH